jgi:transcriptional regulator with XRE-family HTH domain
METDACESSPLTHSVDFGKKLAEYRSRAGILQKELAALMGWSKSKISMTERGERPADEEFARQADAHLGAEGALVSAWRDASRHATRLPAWFMRWIDIEQQARSLRTWELTIVPGLLQTEAYARAIYEGVPGLTSDKVEAGVAARLERQVLFLADGGPVLRVVLDESVLSRPVGDPGVMAGQLAHLLAMAQHPRITVQVLARASWSTTGVLGAFVIAGSPGMLDMAYVETATQAQITADLDRVAEIVNMYETLQSDALPRSASLNVIRKAEQQWK